MCECGEDLFVEGDECLIRQFQRLHNLTKNTKNRTLNTHTNPLHILTNLQYSVPVSVCNLSHEAFDAVHSVECDGRLLLQCRQGPRQIVLLQVLLDQTNHAVENVAREGETERIVR